MIDIIFTDLDGTLLDEKGKLSKPNLAACIKAQKQGIPVVINTGRYGENARDIARRIRADDYNGYSIGNDGAEIWSFKDKKWIYLSQIKPATVTKLAKWLLEFDPNLLLNFSCINKFYVNRLYDKWQKWLAQLEVEMSEIKDFHTFDKAVSKVMVIVDHPWAGDRTQEFISEFNTFFPELTIVQYHANAFSIGAKDTDKGTAIIWLCHHLGIDVKRSMALGDNANDLSMLKVAGYPIVMDNGGDKIKTYARWVAPNKTSGGVAKAITRFLNE